MHLPGPTLSAGQALFSSVRTPPPPPSRVFACLRGVKKTQDFLSSTQGGKMLKRSTERERDVADVTDGAVLSQAEAVYRDEGSPGGLPVTNFFSNCRTSAHWPALRTYTRLDIRPASTSLMRASHSGRLSLWIEIAPPSEKRMTVLLPPLSLSGQISTAGECPGNSVCACDSGVRTPEKDTEWVSFYHHSKRAGKINRKRQTKLSCTRK